MAKFNSGHKKIIREKWNKPLLEFLCSEEGINDKLIYLGFPSPDASDIKAWLHCIKKVIAFQCRDYNDETNTTTDRSQVIKLTQELLSLNKAGKIEWPVVYDGFLETVIFRGADSSSPLQKFEVNEIITLYNLDFCNNLASPRKVIYSNGSVRIVNKFDVIDRLLQVQRALQSERGIEAKFVLFLTVQCSYGKNARIGEIIKFVDTPPDSETKEYIDAYLKLTSHEQNSRIVRLYLAHTLPLRFKKYGFVPTILPTFRYLGDSETEMLHFCVMGVALPALPELQTLQDVADQKFVGFEGNKMVNRGKQGERDIKLSSVENFRDSEMFQNYWNAQNTTN